MVRSVDRRTCLRTGVVGAVVGLAGCSGGSPGDGDGGEPTPEETPDGDSETPDGAESLPDAVGLEPVATGLEMPLDIAFLPEADRRLVATQPGLLLVHDAEGVRDEAALDLTDRVVTGYEQGLLGIALHPEFAENRRLFVRYSASPRPGTPEGYSHTFVLAEFALSEDGERVDPDSERTVLEIPQPQGNHNAGDVRFGPDGYLYVATGDGGGAGDAGDGHPEDWYDGVEGGNGQNTSDGLLGGILRIDVDGEPTESARPEGGQTDDLQEDAGYAIPSDNPLVDREGHRDEYYAWGLRNPWRTSFDEGRYFVADVGQDDRETINLVEAGGNYGWNVKEGSSCFRTEDCPDETPEDVRGGEPLLDPIVEYPTRGPTEGEIDGTSIVGGHVYRGDGIPGLEGRYVFGDLQPNGRLFVATPSAEDGDDGDGWEAEILPLSESAATEVEQLLAFGRDEDGELYVLGGEGVYRLRPA